MRKLITKDQTIELKKHILFPKDVPANDIRIESDKDVVLEHLNLNIVKYDINGHTVAIFIRNCNINKLILNGNKVFIINNCKINDIYIQSEIVGLMFKNTNIPNLHGRVDLINRIEMGPPIYINQK